MTGRKKNAALTLVYAAYIFMILLYILSSPPFICISTVICAAMHEMCHVLCAKALGRKNIRPLSFSATGLYPELGSGSTVSCILIYASGPAFNILVCAACLFFLRGGYSERIFELFCVNAALALFNLTPVPFSDGDGIMRASLSFFLGERVGGFLCSAVELFFSFLLFVLFSYRFFAFGAGFFSFFCSFIFVMSAIAKRERICEDTGEY